MFIFLFRLFLGYLIAAGLSSSVSLTLTATAWASIWTYGALILGYVLACIAIWCAVALMGLLGIGAFLTGAWISDRIRGR